MEEVAFKKRDVSVEFLEPLLSGSDLGDGFGLIFGESSELIFPPLITMGGFVRKHLFKISYSSSFLPF